MISLARANLIHDWRRHATAIVVLVLAGLLMTIQLGFVLGYSKSYGELQSQLRADVVVSQKSSGGSGFGGMAIMLGGNLNKRFQDIILMHPEVEEVEPWSNFAGNSQWENVNADSHKKITNQSQGFSFSNFVSINPIDPSENSLTYPRYFPDSLRRILETPGVVILPRSSARDLNTGLGQKAMLGNIEVTVGAIVNGFSGGFQSQVFTSPQTLRLIGSANNSPSLFLVKLKDKSKTEQVISQLNIMLAKHQLEAKTVQASAQSAGFSEVLKGSGRILLGSAAFALLVGCAIASQTLRGAFLAQIKEFGSLRALGVKRRTLAYIAMEQAFWTGIVSIPIAAISAHVLRIIMASFDVVIDIPLSLLLASSGLLLLVALIAGLVSLTVVFKAQPAELLR